MISPERRLAIYYYCKYVEPADAYLLHETHCPSVEVATQWSQQWGGFASTLEAPLQGRAWFTHSSSRHTGGTAILLSATFRKNVEILESNSDSITGLGIWSSIIFSLNTRVCRLDSVYLAPALPRNRALSTYFSYTPDTDYTHWFVGGDWNCVTNITLDSSNPSYGNEGGDRLLLHTDAAMLMDVWRHHHPTEREYTHTAAVGTATRIDRIYCSIGDADVIRHCKHFTSAAFSDHHGVHLEVELAATPSSSPSPFWRLHPLHLHQPSVVQLVHAQYKWWLKQRSDELPLGV